MSPRLSCLCARVGGVSRNAPASRSAAMCGASAPWLAGRCTEAHTGRTAHPSRTSGQFSSSRGGACAWCAPSLSYFSIQPGWRGGGRRAACPRQKPPFDQLFGQSFSSPGRDPSAACSVPPAVSEVRGVWQFVRQLRFAARSGARKGRGGAEAHHAPGRSESTRCPS